MKFTGGCIGKIIGFVLTLILGAVLGIGGSVLGIYLYFDGDGAMGRVDDMLDGYIQLDFDEEIRKLSVLDWLAEMTGALSGEASTIGELERYLGMNIISNAFYNMVGIDEAIIKASTLENIGVTLSENLTMQIAKDKFEITFPDMPLFETEEFLAKTLSTAFSQFDQYTLGEIIKIEESSNAVLKEMRGVKLSDIGGPALDPIIKGMFLFQLMNITDESTKTLQALKYACIESQYEVDEDGEFILDGLDEKIYKTKTVTVSTPDGEEELILPLIGINEKIADLGIADVVDITDDSHNIMKKLRDEDMKVSELGGDKFVSLVNGMKLDELLVINETSEIMLQSLKARGATVETLNATVKDLVVSEIFGADKCASGALSLIPADTRLANIPSALTAAIHSATVYQLEKRDVIDAPDYTSLTVDQIAFINNSTVFGILESYIDTIKIIKNFNPLVDDVSDLLSAVATTKSTGIGNNNYSLTEFAALYSQYGTVVLEGDIDVTVVPDLDGDYLNAETGRYEIPVFNIRSIDGIEYTVKFKGGFDVEIMVMSGVNGAYTADEDFAYIYWENATLSGSYYYNSAYLVPKTDA